MVEFAVVRACLLSTILLALGVVAVPGAVATTPSCASVTENVPSVAGVAYVRVAGQQTYEVWQETNDVGGLQRVTCVDGDGTTHDPDTRVVQETVPTPDPFQCFTLPTGHRVCLL